MEKKLVVIGLLGTKLDQAPARGNRWAAWRRRWPPVSMKILVVDRFELLHEQKSSHLAKQVASDIEATSPETEVRRHRIEFRDPWDFEEVYAALHQFSREQEFDTDREEYLVHITTGTHVAQICLFLLTESRHFPGALLQTSPPRRRSEKNARGSYRSIDLDLSRYDQLAGRFQEERRESLSFLKSGIETRNPIFNALIEHIEVVSLATTAPILLAGPTGAGKSQLARRIYELRRHRDQVSGVMVEVNCATIRGDQAMSTLFGHVKGAFTGATTNRAGLLKAADGGVLFLDEVGELGSDEQAMLLRAIEEKSFLPVGADAPIHSDFQLLAGTNRNLITEVANGRFREDLLARINLWSFDLPGLADRRDDIEPNLEFELQRFTEEHGKKVTFNKEARERFLAFSRLTSTPWKANFRDLNAAVVRMATLSPSGRITKETVESEISRLLASWQGHAHEGSTDQYLESVLSKEEVAKLDRFDRVQLAEVIRICRQAKTLSAAGRELFHVSRQAKQKPNDADRLRKYLAKFSLTWQTLSR